MYKNCEIFLKQYYNYNTVSSKFLAQEGPGAVILHPAEQDVELLCIV